MKSTYWYILLVVILVGGLVAVRHSTGGAAKAPTDLDPFISCLADKGAKFYGAFWCPHCQAQKKALKNSPQIASVYVECSTPDTKSQTQVCIDKGITGYPTWEFADGSQADGEQTLEQLSEKTGCILPTTAS